MSRDHKSNGRALRVQAFEGVLRYPDGSVDIAAYAKQAHRERAAAIASSAREGIRRVREVWSVIRTSVAPVARSGAVSGKHRASAQR